MDEDDCMNCGMCESCIERSIATAEENDPMPFRPTPREMRVADQFRQWAAEAVAEWDGVDNAQLIADLAGKFGMGQLQFLSGSSIAARCRQSEDEASRLRAALEMLAQVRHVSGSTQGTFRSHLAIMDAVLAGADVRDLRTVEAIAAGTWGKT